MSWRETESNAEREKITDTIKLLLLSDADVGMPDAAGRTAKDWASTVGHLKAGLMISKVAAGKPPE